MKINTLALLLLTIGVCGVAQADTATASIEVSLTIPKKCTIATPTQKLVIPSTGATASANYTVTCNTGYTLGTKADNYSTSNWSTHVKSGNLALVTAMGTKGPNNTNIAIMNPATSFAGSSVDTFTLTAGLKSAVSATTTAGTYTDQYRVTVTY